MNALQNKLKIGSAPLVIFGVAFVMSFLAAISSTIAIVLAIMCLITLGLAVMKVGGLDAYLPFLDIEEKEVPVTVTQESTEAPTVEPETTTEAKVAAE